MIRHRLLAVLSAVVFLATCAPTVKIEPPDKPIVINLNIKIEQEVRIKISDSGAPTIQVLDPGRPARKLVSEMMIWANALAANAWASSRI